MRYYLNSADKLDPVEFGERSKAVCDAYLQAGKLAKQGTHLISADEKTGIQALEPGQGKAGDSQGAGDAQGISGRPIPSHPFPLHAASRIVAESGGDLVQHSPPAAIESLQLQVDRGVARTAARIHRLLQPDLGQAV